MADKTFGDIWWGSNLRLKTYGDILEIHFNTEQGSQSLRLNVHEVKSIFAFISLFIEEESV